MQHFYRYSLITKFASAVAANNILQRNIFSNVALSNRRILFFLFTSMCCAMIVGSFIIYLQDFNERQDKAVEWFNGELPVVYYFLTTEVRK